MKKIIITEQSNPSSENIDLMNGFEIAKIINNEDKKVAIAIEKELPAIGAAIDLIADSFRNGGRLGYFGAGTSGRIGILDASECPPTFSSPKEMVQAFIAGGEKAVRFAVELAEDKAEFAQQDLSAFNPSPCDVVVGISASGNPAYIIEVLRLAQKAKCKTIAVTTNPKAKMKSYADIFICTPVGPEVITGSSRMKSGSSQKMILNMLSTGAMIRIGKAYKNFMIDLNISNEKLEKRATQIISEITGVTIDEAKKYLANADNNVKLATIMAAKNDSSKDAQELLEKYQGIIRRILEDK